MEKLASNFEDIIFYGKITEQEVPEVLSCADIFVLPSYNDSFGIVLIEAGLNEIPLIAASCKGPREIIEHAKTGLLFPPGDIETLRDKILELVNNPDLRSELGANAQKTFRERFNEDVIASRWLRELIAIRQEYQSKYRKKKAIIDKKITIK